MRQQYSQIIAVPKPFVKWAGGKRQLIPILNENLPKRFGAYYEPFLGGGALLFHVISKHPHQDCNISDLNSDLVLTYTVIRDNVEDLIVSLKKHAKSYEKDSKSYYYYIRENHPRSAIEKASRLLFLNRTCFNGLYRVNSKGKFNVPLGRYTNPNIVNADNLYAVSKILNSNPVQIRCRDFESIIDDVKSGDLIYFDPPYQPVSKTANFTSYTNKDFTHEDLTRLFRLCEKLNEMGCKVLLSNSHSDVVSKMFSKKPWNIAKIEANRSINSNSKNRKGHYELLIKNY